MIDAIASSNLARTFAICLFASAFSLLRFRFTLIFWICLSCCALIFFSFILDVGEVYSYSDIYKRGFWYLGDDVTTWLSLVFVYCVLSKRTVPSCLIAAAIFMSGGRLGIVLLLVQGTVVSIYCGRAWFETAKTIAARLGVGLLVYFVAVTISPHAISFGNKVALAAGFEQNLFEPTRRGYNNCRQGDCLETKLKRPFRMRAFSAVAGLWMTLDGGYPGKRFPNTPEKFAELMMNADPWGINDLFEIKREDWERIGTIQSAYLNFGAGYGLIPLVVVIFFIGVVAIIGVYILRHYPPDNQVAYTVFFIVNAVFNQTQTWLLPGPILFFMALSGAQILRQFLLSGSKRIKSEPMTATDGKPLMTHERPACAMD